MHLGGIDTSIGQSCVQVIVGPDPKARCEMFPSQVDLVLSLPLIPPQSLRAGHTINQMVIGYMHETWIILVSLYNCDFQKIKTQRTGLLC
jgi:hypothetical protein